MFRSEQILAPLYDAISRQAVLAANAERVSGFLGKKITPQLAQEIGSRLSTRIEGRCIKHSMGVASVKVYDKFSRVLRVETTVNDVGFFKHHRKVEHTNREPTRELAPLKKTIYSLIDLREILLGCNQRYLAFLSSLDDSSAGERDLQRLSQPRIGKAPRVKGLNFFAAHEQILLRTLQRGEFNIHGWRRADLSKYVALTPSAISRQLKRLHDLGVIKKVTHSYRYYLTRLGRSAIAAATALTRFNTIPAMASVH
jgi:DNA-binding MarR family transcriptional regulator